MVFLLALLLAPVAEAAAATTTGARSGAIAGTVVLAPGFERSAPVQVTNTTDPEVCGEAHSLEDLELSPRRGVANVIVSLVDVPADLVETARSPPPLVLDNRHCRFEPHAASITVKGVLELRNSDPTLHTVHWYGPTSGNVALPRGADSVKRQFSVPGLYALKCDVHGWMQAFVRVVEHPFHAVSNRGGAFVIDGVPPGSYTLEAWHERLAFSHQGVEVRAGETTQVEITYQP